ncbi:MAG: transporter, substrate-binding protein [Candidatus Dependentiae bacterium]|nr:transporter, substrate-binding protein [Candidatus Dependentiae bacterium]
MKTETRVGIFVIGAVLVFLYLSFNIGALRIDQKNYDTYISFFDDTGGLDLKAAVKTSGVRIGYVEAIYLREGGKAEIHLKILKTYKLALNAYATISQETLLGGKIVELDQGDFSTGILAPGTTLAMPGKSTTSVGDLIDQFRDIAQNVSDIAYSFKTVFSSREGHQQLESTLRNASEAAENIAHLSDVVDRIVTKKEGAINTTIDNLDDTMRELRSGVPKITRAIDETAADIRAKVVPEVAKVGPAFETIQEAAVHAKEGFREAEQVMEKINTGKGVVGKLINEDEVYADLKKTIHGLKEYVSRVESLQIYIDMHSETLFKYARNKGFLEMKIRPSHDYFWMIQICSSDYGTIDREIEQIIRRDSYGNILSTTTLTEPQHKIWLADSVERVTRTKNTYTLSAQFGKRFDRLVLRAGLFEGFFGGAVDYYVPLDTDLVHWVTTLEAYDFQGVLRLDDNRMHVKWINKVMFMKNLYTCFGIDDIVSRGNASPFIGFGLRFTDSDLKYFLSLIAGASPSNK